MLEFNRIIYLLLIQQTMQDSVSRDGIARTQTQRQGKEHDISTLATNNTTHDLNLRSIFEIQRY